MIDGVMLYLLLINAALISMFGLLLLLRPLIRKTLGVVTAYRLWLAIPITCAVIVATSIFSLTTDGEKVHQKPTNIEEKWDDVTPLYSVPQKRLPDVADDGVAPIPGWVLEREDLNSLLSIIWIVGVFLSVGVILVRERNLRRISGELTYNEDGYYYSSNSRISPMLVGLFNPKIIVPADFNLQYSVTEQSLILAHERCHYAAGDHIVNAAIALIQCINWFNPFVYLARSQLLLDQELACDARVLTKRPDAIQNYMRALMKAQHVSLESLLKAAWGPTGDHPLVVRVKHLSRPTNGVFSGSKRYLMLAALCVTSVSAAIMFSRTQIIHNITDDTFRIANAAELQLIEAVKTGDHDTVLSLLEDGIDPNINIAPFGTPLIIAAQHGDLTLLDMLIGAGAKINYAARGRGFPLLAAVESGDQRAVEYLLKLGAQPNARVIENDASPLVTAARLGKTKIVTTLLDYNANPNMVVDDEGTALIAASAAGQSQIVDLLIKNNAEIDRSAWVERKRRDGSRFHETTTAIEEAEVAQHNELSEYLKDKTQMKPLSAPP